ncbi:spiro-SPASM protein [Treponema sp.]|uniref:spiro-SPASM protein n=1 Tax=Treponema sp. TaxID=166 RepID=UPI003F0E6B75
MKNLVFLYAGENDSRAFDKVFSGKSAFERCLEWAGGISGLCGISVACCGNVRELVESCVSGISGKDISVVSRESWNTAELLQEMSSQVLSRCADNAVYSIASRPFIDSALTEKLIKNHRDYISEYTFADGYPCGFSPEIISSGTLKILSAFACETHRELGNLPVSNESVFNVMKADINSFEIESVLAPKDYRMLRLDFSCSQKRNFVACKRLYEAALENSVPFTADELSSLAEKTASVQHTLPAFYNIQISENCRAVPFYNPYPDSFKNKYGFFPLENENPNPRNLSLEKFSALMNQIENFSEDAVVGLGAWGEPLLNPELADFVEEALRHSGISVLIETDGTLVTEQLAFRLHEISERAGKRKDGKLPLTWIVSVDSFSEAMYSKIFSGGNFNAAVNSVSLLNKFFPGAVYPQFMRMNENEAELEAFYRFWHAKDSPSGGNLIIQKYDDFCKMLGARKPADLSPLERNVCWHLKRDMTILCGGDVPLCREFLLSPVGNAFDEGIENIWKKMFSHVELQLEKKYGEKCRECDEYYTFNF